MTANSYYHTQWWEAESIFSKIRKKTRMSTLINFSKHSFGSPSHSNQRIKSNKSNPNWKRNNKMVTIFRWHDNIHKVLKTLPEYYQSSWMSSVKFQDTKLIHRNFLHFYILIMNYQKEKLRKHLIYHQIKMNRILVLRNCKTLMKEIEDDTNGKTSYAHGLEELILLKWLYCPRQSTY